MKKLKKWKLIREEDISPSPWFPLFKHTVELPNGKVIDDYYLSKAGDVSMIVALTKQREIVFVRQYKHGAGEIIIELPAGRVKKDTTAEQTAIMELEEETGYVTKEIEFLGEMYAVPSKDTVQTYGFLVRNVEIVKEQNLEETEDIEVLLIPVSEVDQKIKSGEIRATDTIAFIKLAQLKAPELFE